MDCYQGTEPAEVEAQGQIFDGGAGERVLSAKFTSTCQVEPEDVVSSQVCKSHLPFQWDLLLVLFMATLGTFLGIQEGIGVACISSTAHLPHAPFR